jgi:hypothetical protein
MLDAAPFCVTLEPYNRHNEKGKSCIPAGQYVALPYNSPRFGPIYLLVDTANREMIELHAGNSDNDTRGCILLAQHYGKLWGDYAVLNSGSTFKRFLEIMNGDKLFLTIADAY